MISLIDKLRDFHLNDYISLPRIAVLGEQSAGKSSLLESICGLNFLPRGGGIVTRRPLELRMIRAPVSAPYFIFPKDKGETKFTDTDQVRQIIEDLTEEATNHTKNISDIPITCTVYSSEVPDLTLIDLPGITRNPIKGQPDNIEELLKNLVRKYCENPETLILCVIPANIDLANSEALKFARHLD
jgi:GTPase SAR1 family protein